MMAFWLLCRPWQWQEMATQPLQPSRCLHCARHNKKCALGARGRRCKGLSIVPKMSWKMRVTSVRCYVTPPRRSGAGGDEERAPARCGEHRAWRQLLSGGGAVREFSGFPGAHPGAQIRASRPASAPTRRAARVRWDGTAGWSSFPTTLSGHLLLPSWRPPRLVPRYGPPRARAPGPQMLWVAPGRNSEGGGEGDDRAAARSLPSLPLGVTAAINAAPPFCAVAPRRAAAHRYPRPPSRLATPLLSVRRVCVASRCTPLFRASLRKTATGTPASANLRPSSFLGETAGVPGTFPGRGCRCPAPGLDPAGWTRGCRRSTRAAGLQEVMTPPPVCVRLFECYRAARVRCASRCTPLIRTSLRKRTTPRSTPGSPDLCPPRTPLSALLGETAEDASGMCPFLRILSYGTRPGRVRSRFSLWEKRLGCPGRSRGVAADARVGPCRLALPSTRAAGRNGAARVRSASVSFKSIVRPASGARP
eukprot:gene20149-biopygen10091